MAKLQTNSRLRKVLKKVQKPQSGWLDIFPAVIGKADGTVPTGTAGEIYVRNILNGQVIRVHNTSVPNIAMLQVEVGRKVEHPNLWQVKGERETFPVPAGSGYVPYHASQHVFPAADTVFSDRKQIVPLTILVKDAGNFVVSVYGAIVHTANGIRMISTEDIDLSSYVPDIGAVYVSIECDDDGALTVHEGTAFASPASATVDDIPTPASGKYFLGFILLYEGQTELSNSNIRVVFPLGGVVSGTHAIFSDAEGDPADVTEGDPTDGTSTFAARRDHVHHMNPSHVHSLERWNGASGQNTFELSEIVMEIESLSLNGLEEDPLVYSLSADGTQIVLDTALPADMTVIAHTVLETT
jgi:hypothetical protein